MWEAWGLENEDLLWAAAAFRGGIGGQRSAACGAVGAAGIAVGLRHISRGGDREKSDKAREAAGREAGGLVKQFIERFGAVACQDLIDVDFSDKEAVERARREGVFDRTCHEYIRFVLGKLYEL